MLSTKLLTGCVFNTVSTKQLQQTVIKKYVRFICVKPDFHKGTLSMSIQPQSNMHLMIPNQHTKFYYLTTLPFHRCYSDKVGEKAPTAVLPSSEKLKKAVKEYGSTVIIFHIGISLISLGIFYALVSSGIDITVILQQIGLSDEKINKLAGNAGTFVVAYAVHKLFTPVRMGITLTATPLIVRHLRKIGWLKK